MNLGGLGDASTVRRGRRGKGLRKRDRKRLAGAAIRLISSRSETYQAIAFMSLDELAAIAEREGTDKWGAHRYAQHYANHLSYLRDREFSLLEIGIGGYDDPKAGGGSLRTWADYFPKAKISGLDYFDKTPHAADRIKIYKGSQADPRVLSDILKDNPDGFEVVIDDGSHRSEHVIATFMMLWQFVKIDGWYIVEDLQTSYWPGFGGDAYDKRSPHKSMGFFKSLIDGLNWQEMHQPDYAANDFDKSIVAIYFYHNMVFIRKGVNFEGSNYVANSRIPNL